jgi:tetratricopeptide (TPR) repeat protein
MKQLLLLLLVYFTQQTAFGQLPVFQPGLGTVVSTVSSMGRGIREATEAKNRERDQEERDYMYWNFTSLADTFYVHQQYEKAISQYQKALEYRDEQYPKDRIVQATAAIGRLNNDPYQLIIDKADSLFGLPNYEAAVEQYQKAIAIKSEQYPKDQIAKANLEIARRKSVHFSGLAIAGERINDQTSKAFSDDPWSDFIVVGKYEWVDRILTYSNFTELDGIAIPVNTRLVIYSERNFKGTVLLDVTGPAIVYNSANAPSAPLLNETFTNSAIQETFPPEVRMQSTSDMHQWIKGSMEILTTK